MKEHLREAALGYLFWTLFQALAPMIWFYPLNELEISGFEAFAVMLFSPVFAGIPFVRTALKNRWIVALFRIISVAALASFQMETTLRRLIVLSVGCFAVMLVLTATLASASLKQRSHTIWGLITGLFAFISCRVWYTSFVPAWWDQTSNSVVIAVSAVATLDKIFSGDDDTKTVTVSPPVVKSNWLSTAFGFGSLLYLTQAVFGDLSLVSRWVVKGYPNTGPMPYPWGAVILLALFVGAILAWSGDFPQTFVWWLIGSLSFGALYNLPTWQGFAGGVVLAIYVMSVWPFMLDRLSACPPARTLTLAAVVWLIETLYSVWTVAYNFVPGGEYTREHTGWLIIAVMISLGLATFTDEHLFHMTPVLQLTALLTTFICTDDDLVTLTVDEVAGVQVRRLRFREGRIESSSQSHSAFAEVTKGHKMPDKKTKVVLLAAVLIGLSGFVARYPRQTFEHPPKVQPRADFTAAIWTYHFGYDNVGWPSLERSAQLLNDTGADVITLLESDASKPFLGNNDLAMWLSERLQMYIDFGPSTRDHTWGNLLLSKYPIVKSTHHLLPSPYGELAPAITATVNMTGNLVDFVVTHMGNDRDVTDRDLQAKFLARELNAAENPVVFLGYVTSAPFSRDYKTLTEQGRVKDIDRTDRKRWCEYIMYRGLTRLGYARVSHGGLSDTEVQIGRFRFPPDGSPVVDNDYVTTDPKLVEPEVRFNPVFGGYSEGHNWIQEHRYHMNTPKYFTNRK